VGSQILYKFSQMVLYRSTIYQLESTAQSLKAIEEGVTVFKYFVTVATGEYSHGGTDTLARSKGNWHGHTSDRDVRPVDLQSRTAAPHNSDWTPRLCGLALSSGWEGKKISSYGHRTRYG
jgi:hypothetical protein